MRELVCAALIVIGTLFMILGALGLLRLPDFYMRMSATAKTSTLGVSFFMLAVAVYFDDVGVVGRSLAVIVFIFITTPVSAHILGRAAYLDGVPRWPGTVKDELRGKYNRITHVLAGNESAFAGDKAASAQSPPPEEMPDVTIEDEDKKD